MGTESAEGVVNKSAEGTSMTAEDTATGTVVITKNGIKRMIGIRCLNVRRAGGHENTCDIKNDCPA
ncbi:MAG: hypothetical protein ACHQ0Y_13085 [Thermodesulfovibrionales bacterium]